MLGDEFNPFALIAVFGPHITTTDRGGWIGAVIALVFESRQVEVGAGSVESDNGLVVSIWHIEDIYTLIPAIVIGQARCAGTTLIELGVEVLHAAKGVPFEDFAALDFLGDAASREGSTIGHGIAFAALHRRIWWGGLAGAARQDGFATTGTTRDLEFGSIIIARRCESGCRRRVAPATTKHQRQYCHAEQLFFHLDLLWTASITPIARVCQVKEDIPCMTNCPAFLGAPDKLSPTRYILGVWALASVLQYLDERA